VIKKLERQVRKAPHCGSKQQQRLHIVLILLLLVRDTYIWVLLPTHISPAAKRTLNTTPTEWLQYLQQSWARLFEMTESERDK